MYLILKKYNETSSRKIKLNGNCMAVIAFIPVRGGSKSIPLKNIKPLNGKPLVCWSIEALEACDLIDAIVVATDSVEIEKTILQFKYKKTKIYHRNSVNATDTASTESVMLEYITNANLLEDDVFVLVQATSPLTSTNDFSKGLKHFFNNDFDSLLSCVRYKRFFWNENGTAKNYDFEARPRRQEFQGELMENGAFYINKVGNIIEHKNRLSGKIGIYEMPEYTAVEIDEPEDWVILENLIRKHTKLPHNSNIKLFLSDIDGVLTDGGMYYSENGDELKKFNTKDGMAFQLLKENGLKIGFITSENTKIVERRAKKLNVDYLYQGKRNGGKLEVAKEICKIEGISLQNVAYVGDDINCFELLSNVGLAFCPSDAVEQIKNINGIIKLNAKGGEGVIRECYKYIVE